MISHQDMELLKNLAVLSRHNQQEEAAGHHRPGEKTFESSADEEEAHEVFSSRTMATMATQHDRRHGLSTSGSLRTASCEKPPTIASPFGRPAGEEAVEENSKNKKDDHRTTTTTSMPNEEEIERARRQREDKADFDDAVARGLITVHRGPRRHPQSCLSPLMTEGRSKSFSSSVSNSFWVYV